MKFDAAVPVLVTGGSGFIGSHLVERLVELGARVRCLVRSSSSLRWLPGSRIELVRGDLTTGEGLREAVEDVETIFHAAGVTKANSPGEYFRGNLDGTGNLLGACEARGGGLPQLIHVSSLAAIGPSAEGRALLEDAEPRPLSNYGRSKLAAERAVRSSRLGTEAVIVRPAVVYGPRDTDVCHIFRAASRGLLVRIGREESWISIIYVKDLVDALITAATSEGARGRTYFVANVEPVSWTEVASTAARLMGRRLRTISVPPRLAYLAGLVAEMASRRRPKPSIISREKVAEARCRYWICDTSRARSELNFSPRRSLGEGIAETLAWYKDAGWLTF